MMRQPPKRIKGHKFGARDGLGYHVAFVERDQRPGRVPGKYLDGLSDRELGAATRRVIEWVMRPGIDTASAAESQTLRRILEDIEIVARPTRPHGGSKWIGNLAVRLVAAVLRRTHEGKSIEQACAELATSHRLPIETASKDSERGDTVVTTFKRARKHLQELGMLKPLVALLRAERVHQGRERWPSPLSRADRQLSTLPEPVLPPDFGLHGAPEPPEWEPWSSVIEFLYGPARQRMLRYHTARNKKPKKTRKRVP